MSRTRRDIVKMVAAASALPFAPAFAPALAQTPTPPGPTWPASRVRFLVGTAAGGSPDVIGRMVSEKLSEKLGAPIYVENLTTAAGAVAYRTIAKSAPDGGTIGILTSGFAPEVTLRPDPSYDPVNGFTFVTMLCAYPLLFAVPKDSPIKSFADMLDRARKQPGKLTYTITGYGSAYHILTKLVELESGVSMSPVPYRGIAAGVMDVMSGRVDILVDASTSAMPRIQSGEFRILAVSSGQHFDLMPDAPTISETLKNVDFMSWLCLAAPSATPKAMTDRLSADVRSILVEPTFTKRLNELGSVPKPTTPDETRRIVTGEITRWAEVIKRGNIKVE